MGSLDQVVSKDTYKEGETTENRGEWDVPCCFLLPAHASTNPSDSSVCSHR
jgi:hypothetical protein